MTMPFDPAPHLLFLALGLQILCAWALIRGRTGFGVSGAGLWATRALDGAAIAVGCALAGALFCP